MLLGDHDGLAPAGGNVQLLSLRIFRILLVKIVEILFVSSVQALEVGLKVVFHEQLPANRVVQVEAQPLRSGTKVILIPQSFVSKKHNYLSSAKMSKYNQDPTKLAKRNLTKVYQLKIFKTDSAPVRAVLHVHPVVGAVPNALDAQEAGALRRVVPARERLHEKVFGNFPLSRLHQHPRMDPQPEKWIRWGFFSFLKLFSTKIL